MRVHNPVGSGGAWRRGRRALERSCHERAHVAMRHPRLPSEQGRLGLDARVRHRIPTRLGAMLLTGQM